MSLSKPVFAPTFSTYDFMPQSESASVKSQTRPMPKVKVLKKYEPAFFCSSLVMYWANQHGSALRSPDLNQKSVVVVFVLLLLLFSFCFCVVAMLFSFCFCVVLFLFLCCCYCCFHFCVCCCYCSSLSLFLSFSLSLSLSPSLPPSLPHYHSNKTLRLLTAIKHNSEHSVHFNMCFIWLTCLILID